MAFFSPLHPAAGRPLTGDQAVCWLQRLARDYRNSVAALPTFTLDGAEQLQARQLVERLVRNGNISRQVILPACILLPDHVVGNLVIILAAIERQRALLAYANSTSSAPRFLLAPAALEAVLAYLQHVEARLLSDARWAESPEGRWLQCAARDIAQGIHASRDAFAAHMYANEGMGDMAEVPEVLGYGSRGQVVPEGGEQAWTPLGEFLRRVEDIRTSGIDGGFDPLGFDGASVSTSTSTHGSSVLHFDLLSEDGMLSPPATSRADSPQEEPGPSDLRSTASSSSASSAPTRLPAPSDPSSPLVSPYLTPTSIASSLPPTPEPPSTPPVVFALLPQSFSTPPPAPAPHSPPPAPRKRRRRQSPDEERAQSPDTRRPAKRSRIHVPCHCVLNCTAASDCPVRGRGRALPIAHGRSRRRARRGSGRACSPTSSLEVGVGTSRAAAPPAPTAQPGPSGSRASSFTLSTLEDDVMSVFDDADVDVDADADADSVATTDGEAWRERVVYDPANAQEAVRVEHHPVPIRERSPPPVTMSKAEGKRRCLDGIFQSVRRLFTQR